MNPFDSPQSFPTDGGFVYAAMSPALQDWARANGQLHLVKIGHAGDFAERLDYLNGRRAARGSFTNVDPCLGFADWYWVHRLSFDDLDRARQVEGQIRRGFARVFENFKPEPLIGTRRPANGETELFRVRPEQAADLEGVMRTANPNRYVAQRLRDFVTTVIDEIVRHEHGRATSIGD